MLMTIWQFNTDDRFVNRVIYIIVSYIHYKVIYFIMRILFLNKFSHKETFTVLHIFVYNFNLF